MIQTKEELFIAELGGNPQQEIELSYGAKIKITDLLSKYLKAINHTHCCKSDSELLSNLKNKLSFRQWKEVNNYRLTGNDLIKKGKLTFTATEVFEQYKEYVREIA